jgi:hypothetical protein
MPKLSDIDVVNLALDRCAQSSSLTSLTDGSQNASIAQRNYYQTVRAVLRAGRWKSARVKVQLGQRTDVTDPAAAIPTSSTALGTPVGGWPPGNVNYPIIDSGPDEAWNGPQMGDPQMAYAFQLPQDYLRIVRFNDVDSSSTSYPFWAIRADLLWTNQTVAYLEYVRDVTMSGVQGSNPPTIATLDPDLQECIVVGLAARLAWVYQQRTDLQDKLKQEFERLMARALAVDSRSEKVALRSPYIDSSWIRSRWVSTNR